MFILKNRNPRSLALILTLGLASALTAACSTKVVGAPASSPGAISGPGNSLGSNANLELPEAVPNLAAESPSHVLVDSRIVGQSNDILARLGSSWSTLPSGQVSIGKRCVDSKWWRKNPVKAVAPFRTTYRLEITTPTADGQMTLLVSANVVQKEYVLHKTEISQRNANLRKKDAARFTEKCGEGYLAKIEIGGHLEKVLPFRESGIIGTLPVGIPSVFEVGESKEDLAYFEALLKKTLANLTPSPEGFAGVWVNDSRGITVSSPEIGGLSSSFDYFFRYTEDYKKSTEFKTEVPVGASINPYLNP